MENQGFQGMPEEGVEPTLSRRELYFDSANFLDPRIFSDESV
jgi:hypothetical protein